MQDNKAILAPDNTYHIYNRANGNERLFLSDGNYRYFLQKYNEYINPFVDTFCYCLMPNHFHLLVRIKQQEIVESRISDKPGKFQFLERPARQQAISTLLSQQFSNMFNGYAQAFNRQQGRKGSLFMHTFKRKPIRDEAYLRKLIHYIHSNPVKAGLAKKPDDWRYSSYKSLISNNITQLQREETIAYFDDVENFKYCHSLPPDITGID